MEFPTELVQEGLSEKLLSSILKEMEAGSVSSWKLLSTPTIGFYRKLHNYLKRQSKLSKSTVGRLYCLIDRNFQEKGGRPDNVYRFVDNIVSSTRQSNHLMLYNIPMTKSTHTALKKCSQEMEKLNEECVELRKKLASSRSKLRTVSKNFREENQLLRQKCERAEVKVLKLKDKTEKLKEECIQLEIENLNLIEEEEELYSSADTSTDRESTFQDIIGHRTYSPEIRMLYYSLLENQVPVSKVTDIIRSVLRCFNPSMNVEELRLPQKTCAAYMRKEELKIISDAHKAHIICNDAREGKGVNLNTDGTTKEQRKLGGVVANNVVVSVNELPDGKAISAIEDISREFEKLRRVATELGIPNAKSINWTLIKSSQSDSAATQKCMNKLIEEKRLEDEQEFGPASGTLETVELIETFCSMHLGVNLRKAFLSGTMESQNERYHRVDSLVHEFCKLFGNKGCPEYACGVLSFPDFLKLQISATEGTEREYYQTCSKVKLHRQVGSRYFVAAANGCKILYLKKAAIDFLKFTGKDKGNRLEREVFAKLHDMEELAHLQADALMYYHIYGDLYMLSKSIDLGLSVLSMNQHYLELYTYLSEVESSPDIVLDPDYHVFQSEKRIYGSDAKVNHRLKSQAVYEHLFKTTAVNHCLLTELLAKGAKVMREKLCMYAEDQLPGGRYWQPDQDVQDILCQIKPSNDVCESVLGLNDYLTSAIPNLHQLSRSNLVEVKKNKTLKWLSNLPSDKQTRIVDFAVKQRRLTAKECQEEETKRAEQRQKKMLEEHEKRVQLEKKQREEKEKLSQCHLIISSDELKQELLALEKESRHISTAKMVKKKIELLKMQVRIRKKVLCQTVPIVFTTNRKQRPLMEIQQELCDFIDESVLPAECESFIRNPTSLIGRKVMHRFLEAADGTSTWYSGTVLDYSQCDKTHCLTYEGESENCDFDLTLDLILGDLIIL